MARQGLMLIKTQIQSFRYLCRQIRSARRNGPLRYIIPHPDDLPPPYSKYGPAVANGGQSSEGTRNSAPGMKITHKKSYYLVHLQNNQKFEFSCQNKTLFSFRFR